MELIASADEARQLFMNAWLADSEAGWDLERTLTDKFYAQRAATHEWLRSRGYDPVEVFGSNEDLNAMTKAEWRPYNLKAMEVCTREWYDWMLNRFGDALSLIHI